MNELVSSSSIRTFLLIENRLLREAFVRLFSKRADLLVVGQSGYSEESTLNVFKSECDVLLIDSLQIPLLPRANSPENSDRASFKVVVIARDSGERQFLAAVRLGVTGYLLQDASASDVVSAVRAVSRGEAVCPPQLCSALFRFVAQKAQPGITADSSARPDLTLRQQQLVTLVAKGLTNKEIASRLNLSEFTVRNHIHRILKQVDADSRSQAVETIRSYGYSISS
jgi:DNA-binding NarL/FixJ family response regulator